MTTKQRRFVKERLTDFNATQAAIRAGHFPKGASVQGARLLGNAKVQAEIERIAKKKDAGLDLSNGRILRKIAQIAFSSGEETKDCLRALDLLCKARGMYRHKPEQDQERVSIVLNMGGNDAGKPAPGQEGRAGKPPQKQNHALSAPRGRMVPTGGNLRRREVETGQPHNGSANVARQSRPGTGAGAAATAPGLPRA